METALYTPTTENVQQELALTDLIIAEALEAYQQAKADAQAKGKPTPQGALRLAAQMQGRRMALKGLGVQPKAASKKRETPNKPVDEAPMTPPVADTELKLTAEAQPKPKPEAKRTEVNTSELRLIAERRSFLQQAQDRHINVGELIRAQVERI